jgi:hypothetical protein
MFALTRRLSVLPEKIPAFSRPRRHSALALSQTATKLRPDVLQEWDEAKSVPEQSPGSAAAD